MDDINAMVIEPDPRVTTPNNCTCTSICRCGLQHSDCDPGNPISFYPESSTYLGEVLDWCNTGNSWDRNIRILDFHYNMTDSNNERFFQINYLIFSQLRIVVNTP